MQVTAVDKSAGTTMCVLGVLQAVSKQWGAEVTASRVLPILCPLAVVGGLSADQFRQFMKVRGAETIS